MSDPPDKDREYRPSPKEATNKSKRPSVAQQLKSKQTLVDTHRDQLVETNGDGEAVQQTAIPERSPDEGDQSPQGDANAGHDPRYEEGFHMSVRKQTLKKVRREEARLESI